MHDCTAHAITDTKKRSVDPTHTSKINAAWRLDARIRIRRFEQRAKQLVKVTDGIGLAHAHFKAHFERLVVGDLENPWFARYVRDAYKNGWTRAAKKLGKEPEEMTPVQENVLDFIIGKAGDALEMIAFDATAMLSVRVASVVGAEAAESAISREAKAIENRLNLWVAVFTVAAHAEGTLDYFKYGGVKRVGIDAEAISNPVAVIKDEKVEWRTAKDEKVCPKCKDMEGLVFDIEEAYGLIPLHPNCRCDWIALPDDAEGDVEEELPGESIDRTLKLFRYLRGG